MSHSPTTPESNKKPKGILRNASHTSPPIEISDKLDRQKVLENTRLNAKLTNLNDELTNGDKLRQEILLKKERELLETGGHHLQWDELNLYLTEQDKSALMKIDEPKTPYQGGVDPNNDYYRTDNEDDELDDFALGEPLEQVKSAKDEFLNGGELIVDENDDEEQDSEDNEEEEHELSAEERKKKFEEMRKNHYHMKGEILKHPLPEEDE